MKITLSNYDQQLPDLQSLPVTLQESHQFMMKARKNYGRSELVRQAIDLHLQTLNAFLAKEASGKQSSKKTSAKADFVPKSRGKKSAVKSGKKAKSSFIPQSRGSYNPLPIKGQIKVLTNSPIKIRPGAKPRYWDTVSDSYRVLVPETMDDASETGKAKVEVGFSTAGKIRHQFVYRQVLREGYCGVEVYDAMSGLSMGFYEDDDQKSAFVRAHDVAVDNFNEKLVRSHIRDYGVAPIYLDEKQAAINFEKALPTEMAKKSKSSFKPKSRGKQLVKVKFKKNDLVYYSDSGHRHSIKEVERLDKDEVVYIMENGDRKLAKELSTIKPKSAPKPKVKPASDKTIAEAVKKVVAQGPPILTNPHIPKKTINKAIKAVKALNAAKAKKAKPANEVKKVPSISKEVAFFKRYVNMNGKERTYDQVHRLLTDLQKAITSKEIIKASPNSDDIYLIQENLRKALKGNKEQKIRIVNNDKQLAKWVAIAGGEKVYASINLLRTYLNMQGKEPVLERIETLLSKAKKADMSEDPYEDRVKKMIRNLEKSLEKKTAIDIESVELSGLSGLVGQSASGARVKGRQTSEQMMSRQHEYIGLTGKYARLLGDPEVGAQVLIHGLPGQGKTTFALGVARHLAIEHGAVLYVSGEESGSVTLQDKLKRAGGATPRLTFDDHVPHDVHEFDFLFLDSVQSLHFTLDEMARLRKDNPRLTIFFILQSTKSGTFKGGQGWAHDVDIIVSLMGGQAATDKNRYKALSTISVW